MKELAPRRSVWRQLSKSNKLKPQIKVYDDIKRSDDTVKYERVRHISYIWRIIDHCNNNQMRKNNLQAQSAGMRDPRHGFKAGSTEATLAAARQAYNPALQGAPKGMENGMKTWGWRQRRRRQRWRR